MRGKDMFPKGPAWDEESARLMETTDRILNFVSPSEYPVVGEYPLATVEDQGMGRLREHLKAVDADAIDERLEESAKIAAYTMSVLSGIVEPPIEGGFLGNPPLDERYPDADRILGQGMLD